MGVSAGKTFARHCFVFVSKWIVQYHMSKRITSIKLWLAKGLNNLASLLERTDTVTGIPSKFVDLAPTDEADKDGVYSEALLFATSNENISNIALTGPYGSGKSSIIRSFLKRYQRPALSISLAAFVSEVDKDADKVSKQEIERSILQQMLYGADANKLPLSRFKRIRSPGSWSRFKSLYILLGVLALWYVFSQRADILSGYFSLSPTLDNFSNLAIVVFAVIFAWVTIHHFYIASLGLSIKSISLQDIEIKSADEEQTSILNRHLDEIVYFFQSTDYELVIIEDLDRFNNAEIFVTLREINSLVNQNAGVKRTIRFLYALRDDMFVNIERTKFFEFIIPVVPIINSSNSIDMVLAQGKRLELEGGLDPQFLREVSRYLDDLRLIQNIFNEYAVYVRNLVPDGDNQFVQDKLLAILIYKNVYPKDFEELHRGKGKLAGILKLKDELIGITETRLRTEIAELEDRLEAAERQIPSDLKELRQIYAMALIEKLPTNATSVSHNQQVWMGLPELVGSDLFEQMLKAQHVYYRYNNNHYPQSLDISELQSEVDSQKNYLQRKKEIEIKAVDNKNKLLRRLNSLRSQIASLRMVKLNELLRLSPERVESFGEDGQLARFLIFEGYIDDTYYQYTSLFHAGRLSPNDNKFLIQIRAFVTPEPGFPIDNAKEVILAMRDEDFRQRYVLNIKLVDCLLGNLSRYSNQVQKLFELLSSEFEQCEYFFDAYYTSGSNVDRLLSGLIDAWEDFILEATTSPKNVSHITQLIMNLPETVLESLARDFDALVEFVSANLPEILVVAPELEPKRLVCLNFKVRDLAAIGEHSEIVRFMFDRRLFELTPVNIEYIFQVILGENDIEQLREKNFTAIRSKNNSVLLTRIEEDFDSYFNNVLLELETNSKEDVTAILEVIRHNTLHQGDIQTFLGRQTMLLPVLSDVPKELHPMLFKLGKIEPTWLNCLIFIKGDSFESECLIDYLEEDFVRKKILQLPIPADKESLKLSQFLLNAASLSDAAYNEYAHVLPWLFQGFPKDIGPTKLQILIDEGKITFSTGSLNELSENLELQVRFVAANINKYLSKPGDFEVDDDFLEELLRSKIDNVAKLRIIQLMDLDTLDDLPKRAALIGSIVDKSDARLSFIDRSIVQILAKHSSPVTTQISLLNTYNGLMTDDDVRKVLSNLPKPYSEIRSGYSKPKLKNTPENLELVKWLDARNIISSWSVGGLFTDDIKVNLYRSR